ncbi:MAG TPA: polymer-forming cytoskeletal protein [Anaerolineae bacterium]
MYRKTRLLTLLALAILAVFVLVPAASAYDGRTGDRVVIAKDEVINDDLFVGGTTVTVDGTVNGDLITAGQTVVVNGKVMGNLVAAGQSVTVNGAVGQDLFAAGAVITLGRDAQVGHNTYGAGAGFESQQGSKITGSLIVAAGQSLVSGQIGNDLVAAAGRVRLESMVGRNAKIAVDTTNTRPMNSYSFGPNTPPMPFVEPGLTFGQEAHVAGSLNYISSQPVAGADRVSSQVTHTLPAQDQQLSRELAQRHSTSSYLFDAVRRLIALLLIGLVIAWLAPRLITGPAGKLLAQPLPSLGIGLVGLVAAPLTWLVALGVLILVAVVFGLLTLGSLTGLTLLAGLPVLGLAAVAMVLVVSYLCEAIVAYLGGRWLLGRVRPEWNANIYAPVLIGLLILGLLFAVPVLGGLLQFLVVLAGLGAIALTIFGGRGTAEATAGSAAETPAPAQA